MAAGGSPVIATAAIGLIPTIQGVRGNIASQLAGSQVMRGADRAGQSIGSRLGSTITSSVKNTLKVGAVVTGAIAGLTLKGGINRALGIEDAQAKMRGLGHDTQTVDKIMGNALASVEGTAYGLDAAATTAAGAVAAGIKPGQELEGVLKTVANTAAASGGSMEEMGNIFNTVAAVGAAYTGDINMLAQRGIPIWQSLSDTLGVSQDEVRKMATQGKIDFATFETAAQDAAGGVATAMGDTARGSIANMMTSFSKLGADIVTRFLPMVKVGAQGIQAVVQALTAKLSPILDALFDGFTPAATAGMQTFFDGLVERINAFDPQIIIDFFQRAREFVGQIDFSSFSGFTDSLAGIISAKGDGGALSNISGALLQIVAVSPGLIADSVTLLGAAVGFLADHAGTLVKLLPFIVTGLIAWNAASKVALTVNSATLPIRLASNTSLAIANGLELLNTSLTIANSIATGQATIATRIHTIATNAGAVASKAAAVATRLLGAALRFATGPIGLVITGITLLVGALIWFFTKTEVGQKMWSKIWGAIKDAAAAVVTWFTGTALPVLQTAWGGIASGAIWLYENAIVPAWSGIKTAIQVVGDWVTGSLWPALQTAWEAIGAAAMWLWQTIIQPAWTGIKTAIAISVTAVLVYIDLLKWYFSNVIAPVALWLWNNVMKPVWTGIKTAVAIAVTAINVYIDLLKWYFQNVIAPVAMWLWNNIMKPVWAGIKAAIGAVVTWLTDTAWPLIKKVWNAIATSVTWLYQSVIKPVWAGIRSAISAVVSWLVNSAWPIINKVIGWLKMSFEGWKLLAQAVWKAVRVAISVVVTWFRDTAWPIISKVITWIKTAFNLMRDGVKSAWNYIRDKVIRPVATWFRDRIGPLFDTVTGGIGDAFGLLKDTVEKAWNGIRDTAKKPVKFLVETIIRDGIVKKYNEVASGMFGLDKIDTGKFTVGWHSGGWTGPGAKYKPAGTVHADEYVIRKESQRSLRAAAPGFLDALNRHGAKALGYADGGTVKLGSPFRGSYPRGDGFGARGGRHKGIDWPIPSGTALVAVAPGTANRTRNAAAGNKLELRLGDGLTAGYHHLSRFGIASGANAKAGQTVGYVGSTGRSSGPHLHFSLRRNGKYVDPAPYLGSGGAAGSGGGGGWNPFEGLWESLKSKVRQGVGDSAFGDMLYEVPKKLLGSAVTWATDKLSSIGDFASDAVAGAAGRARWSPVMASALRMKGQFGVNNLRWGLNRLMQESGGDPNAVNNWDCVPEDTLILTRRGWLRHDQVQVGDETIGFNPDTGRSEWTRIVNVLHYADADTIRIGNKRWSVRATANHRWVTSQRGSAQPEMRIVEQFNSRTSIHLAHEADTEQVLHLTDQEAEILGWIAGDGHIEKPARGRGSVRIGIGDSKVMRAERVLEGIPHVVYSRPGSITYRLGLDWWHELRIRIGLDPKSEADRLVLLMSTSQRAAWLRGIEATDGHRHPDVDYRTVSQTPGAVADAIVLAGYLTGHRVSRCVDDRQGPSGAWEPLTHYGLCKPTVTAGASFVVEDAGVTDVWCVTTELGTWTAEQDGQVFLTGNSNAKNGTPSKGLMQVIGPTFRAYAEPGYSSNILDPMSNILASINYTLSRYGSLRKGWTRAGGYADGGLVTPFLYDQGGKVPPGVRIIANKTRRPETMLPAKESQFLESAARRGNDERRPLVQTGDIYGHSAEEVAMEIEKKRRRQEALYARR